MSERLAAITRTGIDPALRILPGSMDSPRARIMLCAIALQESRALYRRQHGDGPARGLWQFEQGGGVRGVLHHHASAQHAARLCDIRRVDCQTTGGEYRVWKALETDDVLAAGFARLLLYTHPPTLPSPADANGAELYYMQTWRPGRPHPKYWPANHAEACQFITLNQ